MDYAPLHQSPAPLLDSRSLGGPAASREGAGGGVIISPSSALNLHFFFTFLSVCLATRSQFFFLFLSLTQPLPLASPARSALRARGELQRGSGWLSLLEADGRPKARRPQFHEAWFEHARIMSRGIPMDDGCLVCASLCLCVRARVCLCVWGKRFWGRVVVVVVNFL